jgi:hypothetical protein
MGHLAAANGASSNFARRELASDQKRASSVEVIKKQVQPVSLQTR